MRDYRVIVKTPSNSYWWSFKDIEDAVYKIKELLYKYNNIGLLDKGEFIRTFCLLQDKYFDKQYKITCLYPYCEIYLKKISSGSWNNEDVLEVLKSIKNKE